MFAKAYLYRRCRAPSHVAHRVSQRKYKPATKTYAATSLSLYRKDVSLEGTCVLYYFLFRLSFTGSLPFKVANVPAGAKGNGDVVVHRSHSCLKDCHNEHARERNILRSPGDRIDATRRDAREEGSFV